MTKLLRSALFAVFVMPALASAAPCAGFSDVDSADPFCPSVEWMRNRAVTTGCGGAFFCPSAAVSRLQMAAFLNRFANALTPVYLGSNLQWSAVNGNLTPGVIVCPSGAYTPSFPGLAHGYAMASATPTANDDADVAIEFVVSTDNGATFASASPRQTVTSSGSPVSTGRTASVAVLLPPTDLAPGTNYRFALRILRAAGSTTTADAAGVCQLHVLIENRNPTTPPLDGWARDPG
ncbi:MAG TPA: hypothetical protein VFX05_10330 [Casimicrobiaceae bacterium]|nr:hypothetical protein [Casimicrobiaceae bacterium]